VFVHAFVHPSGREPDGWMKTFSGAEVDGIKSMEVPEEEESCRASFGKIFVPCTGTGGGVVAIGGAIVIVM